MTNQPQNATTVFQTCILRAKHYFLLLILALVILGIIFLFVQRVELSHLLTQWHTLLLSHYGISAHAGGPWGGGDAVTTHW